MLGLCMLALSEPVVAGCEALLAPPQRLRLDHRLLTQDGDQVLAASLTPVFGFEAPAALALTSRGCAVAGYQLVVSRRGSGVVVWDSGVVFLNASASAAGPDNSLAWVPLLGKPLAPDDDYKLTAIYFARNGGTVQLQRSPPANATFSTRPDPDGAVGSTGELFFNRSTWLVSPANPAPQNTLFRTRFFAPRVADSRSARARVAASILGCGHVVLNGHRLGNAVLGSATQLDKTILYDVHDVTGLLKPGKWNVLGAYTGRCMAGMLGWLSVSGPTAKIALWYDPGGGANRLEVHTGAGQWLSSSGPSKMNDEYLGEEYDARIAEAHIGWDRVANISEARWQQAVSRPPTPALTSHMSPQSFLPMRVITTLPPRSARQPSAGAHVLDFGQEISGWVRLSTRLLRACPAGATIKLRHAETLLAPPFGPATGALYVANLDGARSVDTYTCGDPDRVVETWAPQLTFHGFRYVEISGSGLTTAPTFDDVRAELVHTAIEPTGALALGGGRGAQLLNSLHSNILWSQRDNLMGIPIAQNNRNERLGWTGDAGLSIEEASINFDVHGVEARFVDTIRDCLDRDGGVPHVVPGGPGCNSDGSIRTDPSWASVYPQVVWQLLRAYGDRRLAAEHWPSLMRMLLLEAEDARACPRSESPRTAVPNSPGCSPGGLGNMSLAIFGDWTVPPTRDNFTTTESNQVHYTAAHALIRDLQTMVKMGNVLGSTFEQEAETMLRPLLSKLRTEFVSQFFCNETQLFGPSVLHRTTPNDGPPGGQTVTALALSLGLVPADALNFTRAHLASDVLKHATHATVGILGNAHLFEQLWQTGRRDLAEAILTSTSYPSFGFQITHPTQAATTLWERMDTDVEAPPMNSHNNVMWGGGPDVYLYRRVAGIAQSDDSIGWSELEFWPAPSAEIRSASASIHTVRGLASISWEAVPPDVVCGTASETRPIPGSGYDVGGTGSGFSLSCAMPGSVIERIVFASFGDPVGKCAAPGSFHSTACEMYTQGPGSLGTSIEFQCLGQRSCEVQAATMYWSPSPEAFASCPGPNATWSRTAAAVVECSQPGPSEDNEIFLLNVSVPQTATALTHIPRLGRDPLYIWDAHPSNANTSILLWPRQSLKPVGIISVLEELQEIVVQHEAGSYWFVSSTRPQAPSPPPMPPPPPAPPAPPPLAPPGPLPAGDCNVSGVWYGGTAKILLTTDGNRVLISCPSAWGSAQAVMGERNTFEAQGGWCPPPKLCPGKVEASSLGPCSKMVMEGGMWCKAAPGKPHGVC